MSEPIKSQHNIVKRWTVIAVFRKVTMRIEMKGSSVGIEGDVNARLIRGSVTACIHIAGVCPT